MRDNMSIQNRINQKEGTFWDFENTAKDMLHRIATYPATMVPDMQREIISIIIEENPSIQNILDPFHGSGVTLVEGKKLGLLPIGIDINPLAHIITKVKLQGVDKNKISSQNAIIKKNLEDINFAYNIYNFYKIDKWFKSEIIESLSKIHCAIKEIEDNNTREYYWVCLINIVRKYSNTRSSTFKLHIKSQEMINTIQNNVIQDFLKSINTHYKYLPDFIKTEEDFTLISGDVKEKLKEVPKESVDLICTSPPYGDNSTTVTYGQYSMLPLYWIASEDLKEFDEELLKNYSSLDSASLGGIKSSKVFEYDSAILKEYLSKISEKKHRKVIGFINDYIETLQLMLNSLKKGKYIVLTLGNRRVDNKIMPLTDITEEFLLDKGIPLISKFDRNIPSKRIPRKISRVNDIAVESMSKEYIMIFQK
ncbi:DNA methyltransferase [Lactococcus lactis]|uniref:DNA methyltransferase n=1 Tax=Lactococcus lactis TaxID=1358 RepID=UPI0024168C96|nr:DNA methyltransferase [Lactococcus lactis]MDG4967589.1 site-specific DNA-methyltransferase [Lactococcus lactis]MDG5101921.1 site-specific DNA-methyltransferase [Lactococcus lactis]